jgi:hypothetical protein
MVKTITNAQKRNLLSKAQSGKYYLYLTEYDNKKGQYIIVFPTNKGLEEGVTFRRNFYPVRLPKIPRPGMKNERFDRSSGTAYKEGRFFRINDSMAKVLNWN